MPHPVDEHVGARIKALRKTAGLSQEALATQVGVSFQQLQKYERGANRVSASKLFDIAEVLGVDTGVFFEGLQSKAKPVQNTLLQRIAADDELLRLVMIYEKLSTDEEKRRLVRALEIVAGA